MTASLSTGSSRRFCAGRYFRARSRHGARCRQNGCWCSGMRSARGRSTPLWPCCAARDSLPPRQARACSLLIAASGASSRHAPRPAYSCSPSLLCYATERDLLPCRPPGGLCAGRPARPPAFPPGAAASLFPRLDAKMPGQSSQMAGHLVARVPDAIGTSNPPPDRNAGSRQDHGVTRGERRTKGKRLSPGSYWAGLVHHPGAAGDARATRCLGEQPGTCGGTPAAATCLTAIQRLVSAGPVHVSRRIAAQCQRASPQVPAASLARCPFRPPRVSLRPALCLNRQVRHPAHPVRP